MSSNTNNLRAVFDRLRSKSKSVFLLDGGTGEELFRRGVPDDRKIWSATALVHEKHHETLRQVHASFLQAGSVAVTTNSYGVVPGVGFVTEERRKYIGLSGKIAREAVSTQNGGFVFGSLGPLVESYRADLIKDHDEGVEEYKIACRALLPYVDAYLAETMSCVEESAQAMDAVAGLKGDECRPMLLSYTLDAGGSFRDQVDVTHGIRQILKLAQEKKIECTYWHDILQSR
jgi:S-methylmethionine-dependent homocysteine/selenocysteine methylase